MPKLLFSAVLLISILGYSIITTLLFKEVYITSQMVIDEEFHIPQGLSYCNFTFNSWNPKITTLPGLYLLSAALLGPFKLCSIYWLRFVNVIGSLVNFLLFYLCFKLYNNNKDDWVNLLSTINLAFLPPLYFFSHLYYTDVLSVTFVLLMVVYNKKESHLVAAIFGMFSIVMRQTNVIWVTMLFGEYALTKLVLHSSRRKRKSLEVKLSDIWEIKTGASLKGFSLNVWLDLLAYFLVLLSFLLFVVVNGSIVVGDKTAHTASIHVPQLFYFVLFCLVFAWPYFLSDIGRFLKFGFKNKFCSLLVLILSGFIVYFNTLEHPYLLADNRHYTFYIWNRFYARHFWFRYLMVPIYFFGMFGLVSKIHTKFNLISVIGYLVATFLVLIPQKMIEFRYFFLPYILLRLQIRNAQYSQLFFEFLFYMLINLFTFDLFFNKDIYWRDFDYAQKLIW